MADVAGLVVGTIALATLFSTCVDLCDRFELGKTYASDYDMSCNKVTLLKLRLLQWGRSLDVDRPGHEHPSLRAIWPEHEDVVAQGLLGMQEIIARALVLEKKYKLTGERFQSHSLTVAKDPLLSADLESQYTATTKLYRSWSAWNKRARWAFHGKDKFDKTIGDLAFLMDQLDAVKESVAHRPLSRANMSSSRHTPPESTREEQAGKQGENDTKSTKVTTDATTFMVQLPSNFQGNIFTGEQENEKNGIIGYIGERSAGGNDSHRIYANVKQRNKKSGVIGSMSDQSAHLFFGEPSKNTGQA